MVDWGKITGNGGGTYAPLAFDAVERTSFLVQLNAPELLDTLSSLETGAFIQTPESRLQSVWNLLQWIEFPVSLCDAIAPCINDPDSPVYEQLRQFLMRVSNLELIASGLRQLQEGSSCDCAGFSIDQAVQGLGTETNPSCDLNILWGQCQALIEFCDQTGRDAIEIVGAWQNDGERIAGLIRAVPAVETLPFDEIFNLTSWLADEGLQYYEAGSTIENKLSWACELFCLCKDDCQITLQRLSQAINNAANAEFVPNDLFDFTGLLLNILTNGIGATFAWWAMQAFVVGAAAQTASFFGVTVSWRLIDLVVANGAEGASDGWQLCDCPSAPQLQIFASAWRLHGDTDWIPTSSQFEAITVSFPADIELQPFGSLVAIGNCADSASPEYTINVIDAGGGSPIEFFGRNCESRGYVPQGQSHNGYQTNVFNVSGPFVRITVNPI